MRYFTRAWASGELDDEECETARSAYGARLLEITPRLSPDLLRVAREISLHDALIERVTWDGAIRRLELALLCGDRARGYSLVQLTYDGALIGDHRLGALRRAALSRETQLLYDEVDVTDNLLCHRLLFSPNEEVTIEFDGISVRCAERDDRRLQLLGSFLEK